MKKEKSACRHRAGHFVTLGACALVFCSILLIPSAIRPVEAASQVSDATVKKYEEQLKEIAKKKTTLANNISNARTEQSSALKLKTYLDEQISLTREEIEALDGILEKTEDEIGKKQLEIIDKKAEVDEQKQNFLDRLRITYEEGNTGYLELLLGADSLYDFLTRAERIGYMMDYNINLMEKYKQATVDLEAEEKELEQYKATNEETKQMREEKEAELEQQLAATEADLKALQNTIYTNQALYNQSASEEEKLNNELAAYIKELQARQNAAYVGGEFIWPVDVSWSRISSYYGYRTLNGVREFHRGIDIPASAWSTIYASNSGTVIKAEYHWSYGNYVIIDHGNGWKTLYGHMSSLSVTQGQAVSQGQEIGKVGSTGNSTGNHLHFEMIQNGALYSARNLFASMG